jgi:hypothetical protein
MIVEIGTYIYEYLQTYALPDSVTSLSGVPSLTVCETEDEFFGHETPGIYLCGTVGGTTPIDFSDGNRTVPSETEITIECKIIAPKPIIRTIAGIMQQELYTMIHGGELRSFNPQYKEIPKPAIDKDRASIGILATITHVLSIA